jgi:hypothetical protein
VLTQHAALQRRDEPHDRIGGKTREGGCRQYERMGVGNRETRPRVLCRLSNKQAGKGEDKAPQGTRISDCGVQLFGWFINKWDSEPCFGAEVRRREISQ